MSGGDCLCLKARRLRDRGSAGARPNNGSESGWLRCAVGPDRPIEDHRLVRLYHRFLTWDIVKAPRPIRTLERLLNPILGKSLVVYATKPTEIPARSADAQTHDTSERAHAVA